MTTNLVNNLGGTAGFGEAYLPGNDDGSTSLIDIRSIFPGGLNFFGAVWTGIYINNNGNISFSSPTGTYTPTQITGITSNPIIAAFWADVDTRGTPGGVTPGGTSTGTNLMWYDLDPATGTITVTWDDVGYYSSRVDKLNAFQLQLVRVNGTDFDIIFRYEDVNWTTGNASGGSGGLGGIVARAGYSSGDGLNFFELPQSGNQAAILGLESSSNTGQAGQWVFQVRNGAPVIAVSIADVTQTEGNGPGTTVMTFDVILSSPSSQAVTVDYFTQAGVAGAGDFIPVAGSVMFAPGQTRQTVSVEVIGDTTPEANETFSVILANVLNADIADGTATGTIVNDDGIVISDVQVTEGTGSATTDATFTVTLLSASTGTVTVNFTTAGVTATSGVDFTAGSGTLTFSPGQTTKTVTVAVVQDTAVESDETFSVQLSGASGATIVDAIGAGTIVNDDGFVVNDVTLFEGSGSGTTPFVFNVKLLTALTAASTVAYQVVGVSATAGTDFVAASGTLTFAAGVTQQQVTVNVNKDSLAESDETFQLVLSNATVTAISDGTGIGTIRNDDGIFVSDAIVVEGNSGTSSLLFAVTLGSAASSTVTVNYATAAGTASAGSDYTTTSGTLTFAAGEFSKTVSVPVIGDTSPEADETLTLLLSNAVGTSIIDGSGAGTIRNDDGLSVNNPSSLAEGNTGTKTVTFTVSLSTASATEVRVNYATDDGTASAGSDYVATAGVLTFAPGEISKTVNVTVNGDTVYEPNETFRLVLSNPVGSLIVNSSGTAVLTNDDVQPPPAMYVSDVTQSEGTGSGTSAFHFYVSLSRAATNTVTVSYATASGTATAGVDFTQTSGTLTFAVGETLKEVIVPVLRDLLVEPNESFTLTLSNLTGTATLGDATGQGTIVNDDVTISVNDITVAEGNSGTTAAVFNVSLSGPSPLPVSVDYSTLNGSATAPSDYTLTSGTVTFAPGETTRTVTVQLAGERTYENNETLQLVLSNPVSATLVRATATATVTNDDAPPSLAVNDVSVAEGNSGTTSATFTISLTGATQLPVSVDYATLNGNATAASDFAAATGTVTFAPGETVKQVVVPVTGDAVYEDNETFRLVLSNAVSATLAVPQGTATVLNDDAAPALSVNDVSVIEGNSGTAAATFTISLAGATQLPVSVNYATVNGSATAPSDFSSAAGTVTFAPGETARQVTVQVTGDTAIEATESFQFVLSNPVSATLSDNQGTGTITNDDTNLEILSFNPTDDATSVSVSSNLTFNFSDTIARGAGNIVLRTLGGTILETFNAANNTALSLAGSTLVINPTPNLAYGTGYVLDFAAGSVQDLYGHAYAGGSGYNFTTTMVNPANPASAYFEISQKFYLAYFGRPADTGGLTNMAQQFLDSQAPTTTLALLDSYDSNATVKRIIDSFGLSQESQNLYGNSSTTARITAVYQNLFNRDPAIGGLNFWAGAVDSGDVSLAQAALRILEGAEKFVAADGLTIVKKVTVAENFTNALDTPTEASAYAGAAAALAARTMLRGVDKTIDTGAYQASVQATIDQLVAARPQAGLQAIVQDTFDAPALDEQLVTVELVGYYEPFMF